MRIAIVTAVLGRAGGMGRVAEEYANRLALRGHEVTVFSPALQAPKNGSIEKQNSSSCVIRFLNSYIRYGHAAWVPELSKLLNDFEVVHLQYPFIGAAGAIIKWRKKNPTRKLVITYHMDLIGRGFFRPFFYFYGKLTTSRVLRLADKIIVSSFDYADHSDFAKIFKGVRQKTAEIPFGVDANRFKPRVDNQLLTELGVARDESVVLFVGGLDAAHYFKGVPVLLQAFALLKKYASHVRLIVVGRGGLLETYKKMAQKLKISDCVIFANQVSDNDLPRYYGLADVFVLPSTTRSEAFGLVLLEAQASGVPVITSDFPGVRTVFEDQKTGFIVPANDKTILMQAMAWLLTHPEDQEKMSQAARARMETKYNWDLVIDQLERVYQEI